MLASTLLGGTNRLTHGFELHSDGKVATCRSEIGGSPHFIVRTATPVTIPLFTDTAVDIKVLGARWSLFRNLFSVSM